MKLAILGYGKMGKTIERIAKERGHDIVIIADLETIYDISEADVAIDFSVPTSALSNISNCLNNNVPVISGTTGWLKDYDIAVSLCKEKNGAFIYASNYSLGVNIFFELNRTLAKMMSKLSQYNIDIEEIHHTQKLDAPSGTAISLANEIIKHSEYTGWNIDSPKSNELGITAKRIENVPGGLLGEPA